MTLKKRYIVLLSVAAFILLLTVGFTIANAINEASLNEYIDSFSPAELSERLTPEQDELGNYFFTTDREMRVMHLTDIHIGGGVLSRNKDMLAIAAVGELISREKPDFVVVTGDIAFAIPTTGCFNNARAHRLFIRLMERLGVNYTVAFGNHDSEGYNFKRRSSVADMYEDEALEYSLFSSGPEDVFGECNHIIYVKNSEGLITETFVMLDSNAYRGIDIFGILQHYDRIHDDQVEWYRNIITTYNERNIEVYRTLNPNADTIPKEVSSVKNLLFMHIPIMEVSDAYHEYVNNDRQNTENVEFLGGIDGESGRVVYSPEESEQLFETVLELGGTEAIFYGHDHLNNFVLDYKGVKLSYGYSIDYLAYGGIAEKTEQRGCTVIYVSPSGESRIEHKRLIEE